MFLQNAILKRMDDKNPVKVALIGAGKFGSMFLSQVPSTSGLEVSIIADLKPENAIKACKNVGWSDDLIKKTKFVYQGVEAIKLDEVDVVVVNRVPICWDLSCKTSLLAWKTYCYG